jgi:tripartite-type tricarboxylate transporter receptor subunit TctC
MQPPPSSMYIAAVLAALATDGAMAEDAPYPARPIQVVVPATPGGPVDTAIRMIEPRLSAALGQSLVLINRPGASGIVGMTSVATAAPDGYTIGQGVTSVFTIVHTSGSTVPYELDSFVLIGNYASDASIVAVNPESPWKTFDELIAFARANPGKLSYGSAGIGTSSALGMQAITTAFKLDVIGVPFAGGAQLATAILGRHVETGLVPYSTGAAMLRDNKLRALATTAVARLPDFPDVPTFAEKGLSIKGLDLVLGLYAPKGIPDGNARVLVNALQQTMSDPAVAAKLATVGLFAQYEGPAAARERLEQEYHDILELDRTLKHTP